jgi:hypothetical protein
MHVLEFARPLAFPAEGADESSRAIVFLDLMGRVVEDEDMAIGTDRDSLWTGKLAVAAVPAPDFHVPSERQEGRLRDLSVRELGRDEHRDEGMDKTHDHLTVGVWNRDSDQQDGAD